MKHLIILLCLLFIFPCLIYAEETKSPASPTGGPSSENKSQQITPELEKKITELISQLGVDDWQQREAAQKELLKIGMPARSFLEKTLKSSDDPEVKLRTTQLLKDIPDTLAKETVVKGFENLTKTKGYRFTGEVKISYEGAAMGGMGLMGDGDGGVEAIKIEVVHKNPGLTYIKQEIGNLERIGGEIYRKGNKTVRKETEGEKWHLEDNQNLFSYPGLSPTEYEQIKGYLDKAQFQSDEKINDIPCKVIEVLLNAEGIKKMMPEGLLPIGINLNPKYKIWVGEKDNNIYKMLISMELNMGGLMMELGGDDGPLPEAPPFKMKMNTEIKFSDYNKEIEIKIPEEASKLLEKSDKEPPDDEGDEEKE